MKTSSIKVDDKDDIFKYQVAVHSAAAAAAAAKVVVVVVVEYLGTKQLICNALW